MGFKGIKGLLNGVKALGEDISAEKTKIYTKAKAPKEPVVKEEKESKPFGEVVRTGFVHGAAETIASADRLIHGEQFKTVGNKIADAGKYIWHGSSEQSEVTDTPPQVTEKPNQNG